VYGVQAHVSQDDGRISDRFSWIAHPARERRGLAAAGLTIIAALASLVAVIMQSPWWGLLAGLLLLLSLNRFFLPSRFTIDPEGITASYPFRRQRLRWTDLRRFALGEEGGFLSTRAARSWRDGHRGMHVLFGARPEHVVQRLRAHLPQRGGA
jgi:hypothetical protein